MPNPTGADLSEGTRAFYADLPAFDDFAAFSDPSRYRPLPADWRVVLADIRGSTEAIAQGRYKDVNMMGAACIAAALNALKRFDPAPDIPYVFGGDGATLAVPEYTVDAVRNALSRTRALCGARFGLDMRVGIVPVAEVQARGREVLVAKFRLSPGNHLALFGGGGIETVDALIKDETAGAAYRAEMPDAAASPDLDGLSCRWSPIRPRSGRIVSLLVQSTAPEAEARMAAYRRVAARLNAVLNRDLADLSPAAEASLRFRWPPEALTTEARATAGPGAAAFCRRLAFILLQSGLQWVLHRVGGRAGAYDAPAYQAELIANSDFRRFDDTLRLVLDCSAGQARALEECLADLRRAGGIAYGLHTADSALMTCLVFNLDRSEHVHFIDGGDGGFAVAAKQMKAQLAEGR